MSKSTMTITEDPAKEYLGDGAWAHFDGFGIWITAENGHEATDKVYLEPPVMFALLRKLKHHYNPSELAKALEPEV